MKTRPILKAAGGQRGRCRSSQNRPQCVGRSLLDFFRSRRGVGCSNAARKVENPGAAKIWVGSRFQPLIVNLNSFLLLHMNDYVRVVSVYGCFPGQPVNVQIREETPCCSFNGCDCLEQTVCVEGYVAVWGQESEINEL